MNDFRKLSGTAFPAFTRLGVTGFLVAGFFVTSTTSTMQLSRYSSIHWGRNRYIPRRGPIFMCWISFFRHMPRRVNGLRVKRSAACSMLSMFGSVGCIFRLHDHSPVSFVVDASVSTSAAMSVHGHRFAGRADTSGHSRPWSTQRRLRTAKHSSPTNKASPLSTTDPRISKDREIKTKMIAAMTFSAGRLSGGSRGSHGSSTSDAGWYGLIISCHRQPVVRSARSAPSHDEPTSRTARASTPRPNEGSRSETTRSSLSVRQFSESR